MKAFIIFLLLSSVAFGQWAGWASRSTTTETTEGALRSVNDSLYYFNYPQSTTGKPIYYWWSSSAGYLYVLADSLGVGSAGNPEATGMIKVDSLGDGSLHQVSSVTPNTKSVYLDSLTQYLFGHEWLKATTDDWTIEFWAYLIPDYGTNIYGVVVQGNISNKPNVTFTGYNFDGPIFTRSTGPTANVYGDSAKALAIGRWNHIVFVNDYPDSFKIYQGGIDVPDTLAGSAADGFNLSAYSFGAAVAQAYRFYGYIDELRFWNSARTLSEVNAVKQQELTGSETGLAYYWTFDDALTCDRIDSTNTLTKAIGTTTYSTEKPF